MILDSIIALTFFIGAPIVLFKSGFTGLLAWMLLFMAIKVIKEVE